MTRLIVTLPLACLTGTALAQNSLASSVAVVNVTNLGAVGDGVADDTSAFERAIDLGRAQKLPVHLTRGQYRLTRTIRLENQLMVGQFAGGWPTRCPCRPW